MCLRTLKGFKRHRALGMTWQNTKKKKKIRETEADS